MLPEVNFKGNFEEGVRLIGYRNYSPIKLNG